MSFDNNKIVAALSKVMDPSSGERYHLNEYGKGFCDRRKKCKLHA